MRLSQSKQLTILQASYGWALTKLMRFRSQSTTTLTKQEIQNFQQDGAVCLRGKFSQEWIEKAKEGIRKVYENPSIYGEKLTSDKGNTSLVYFNDFLHWQHIKEISDFVFHSPAAELARQLMMSEKVAFYYDEVFTKDPGTCLATPWHQDQPYYPIDGWKNCSLWMPMEKVLIKDCVKFIKGSHRWEKWFIPKKFKTNMNYPNMNYHTHNTVEAGSQQEYCEMIDIDDKYEALVWDLEPGDCIAFHMLTVHGAPESTDENGRQVLASRWFGDDVVLAQRPWECSPVVVPEGSKAGDSIFNYSDMYPVVEVSR